VSVLRRTALSLATASLALVLAPMVPASADDPRDVPDPATITITGDGYGHGVGMSQYGAYGAANNGRDFKQILSFYYPHTKLGDAAGKVAVLISADDDHDLMVDSRTGLTVRSLVTGKTLKLSEPRATRWRIRPSGSRSEISYRTRQWHTWRVLKGDAELAAGGRPLTLRTPDGPVDYRGALRSTRDAKGNRITVNVVPMEAYVRGVVTSEMFSDWPQQALRAQAVASRTYASYERAHTSRTGYDLCDTAACQAYGGASAEATGGNRATNATARRVVTFGGEVAFAQFSASNGGYTVADGRFSYLPAKEDIYEGTSPDYYGWTATVTDGDIEQAYNIENLVGLQVLTRDGHGGRGGRVLEVRLTSSTGWQGTVTGESFRRNLGLRSTLFTISGVSSASGRSVATD